MKAALARLTGLGDHLWLEIAGQRTRGTMEGGRDDGQRVSAVQYVRFPVSDATVLQKGPAAIVIDHPAYTHRQELPEDDYVVPIGRAAVRRAGHDVTIITFGAMVHVALDAASQMAADGVDVEVLDLRTLVPLDRDSILSSVMKTNKVVVLHEASRTGGIGGEIAAVIAEEAFEYLDAPVLRVASLDTPVPFSPALEKVFMPDTNRVMAAVRRLVGY